MAPYLPVINTCLFALLALAYWYGVRNARIRHIEQAVIRIESKLDHDIVTRRECEVLRKAQNHD